MRFFLALSWCLYAFMLLYLLDSASSKAAVRVGVYTFMLV